MLLARYMAYGDFKDLPRRTAPVKVLRNKTFNIAKNSKYDEYELGLISMVYKFFGEKVPRCWKTPTEKIHKPSIRNLSKRKVKSSFIENILGADLADMQLISKFNKEFWVLLCVVNIYSKYAWVAPLKDKKSITITNAFQQILDESNRKLIKKYGWLKRANFTIDQWNHGCKIMI